MRNTLKFGSAAAGIAATVAVAGIVAAASFGAAVHMLSGTTVTTALSSASTSVGGTGVHDTATVAGLTGSTFTGDTVTYAVYPSLSSCSAGNGGTSEGSAPVTGNGTVAASNTFAATSAGTYYWQATFNGADHTNAAASSDCTAETLAVDAVTTALSSTSTTIGAPGVHDTATVAGLTGSTFTGDTVTYTVYPSLSSCNAGNGGTSEGSAPVTGNGTVAASNTFAPTSAGTYYWQASFNGADHTNAAASSECSSETLSAAAPTVPTVTTELSASSTTVGGPGVHDTATVAGLTGSTFAGDTVIYTVYPSLGACIAGNGGTAEGSVPVSGNGTVAASNTFAPTGAGTYYWQATFSGADKANAAASSSCSAEPLTVSFSLPHPPPPRGRHGFLVCHRVHFGHGRHHHRSFLVCFRVPARGFPHRGQGLGEGDGGSGDQNGPTGDGRR
jgi:hypothetical protein